MNTEIKVGPHQDEFGRHWVRAVPRDANNDQRLLVTLVYQDEEGLVRPIGNGFIILDQGTSAICATAAHNFDYIKRLQRTRTLQSHPSLPPDFAVRGTQYLDTRGMTALHVLDGQPVVCQIAQINYQENYDVAVFLIRIDPSLGTTGAFRGKAALDFAIPQAGDEVMLLGNTLTCSDESDGLRLGLGLQVLFGFVTRITSGQGRMGQSFTFETTIPIEQGLSGSPILKKQSAGEAMTVCGVASHDFSSQEALTNFLLPGCSNCSSLWPALALGFRGSYNSIRGFVSIYDLVLGGAVDSRSQNVVTRVTVEKDVTRIIYQDYRTASPSGYEMTTPVNPLVEEAIPS